MKIPELRLDLLLVAAGFDLPQGFFGAIFVSC